MRVKCALLLTLLAAAMAGCGSGKGGSSAIPSQSENPILPTQSVINPATGNVRFSIKITPKKAAAGFRKPQYIPPSTRSLKILTDGADPVIVNVIIINAIVNSPYPEICAPNVGGSASITCTASLNVPTGDHVFTVTAYDQFSGAGRVLSTNSTGTVYVKPTGTTTLSLVLGGVVNYVILTLGPSNPPVGTAAAIGLTATLEDADQNLIVGPAPYEYPVTLMSSDSANGRLSKTVLTSPADTAGITVKYTGAKVASITYAATATGLPAANVINAVLTPGAHAEHLYTANPVDNTVTVVDLDNTTAPQATISGGGLNFPVGLAIGASGKLYVANQGVNSVSVFDTAHGNAVLPAITGGGLDVPWGAAVDTSGKLYVANSLADSVSVFDTTHGNAVLPAITGGGLSGPVGVAVATSGKLYVLNGITTSISVFDTAHGNAVQPAITSYALLGNKGGLAVDAAGRVYVAMVVGPPVWVFDTAHGNALTGIDGIGLSVPAAVAVDASGKLYVANPGFGPGVIVFDTSRGNVALPPIDVDNPWGVAVH